MKDSKVLAADSVDMDKIIGQLSLIRDSVNLHYQHPVIAPNGKAEGLCLSVRGLGGIIKQLEVFTSKENNANL